MYALALKNFSLNVIFCNYLLSENIFATYFVKEEVT